MKALVAIFCVNEHVKIERALSRFPSERAYDVLVMDDGSTDDSVARVKKFPFAKILSHERNLGVGAAMRTVMSYAVKEGYDVLIPMAGNDKDDPLLIPRLLKAVEEGFDFVQGSRYLEPGSHGQMPLYRVFATRFVHPLLFSLISGQRITDSTNGFRAFRTTLLKDKRIKLGQAWLNQYELEPYLFYKAVKLGYKVKEVPVTKIYPPKHLGYSKMKPLIGWWSILRPLVYLGLGLKD